LAPSVWKGPIVVRGENGRARRITKLEAAVKQPVKRAVTGDPRATQMLVALVQADEARPVERDAERLGEVDAVVMAELARRLRR
jgi:hypothetical protein